MRKIPASGINLFQHIYVLAREYSRRTGRPVMNLSLGNPDTVPPQEILDLQARFAEDAGLDYHTYAEENNLHRFAEAMVELHSGVRAAEHPHLRVLPIPGIKNATAFIPIACGVHLDGQRGDFTLVSNLPAYDVIGTWSAGYLGTRRILWPLVPEDGMRLNVARLRAAAADSRVDLVHVVRPGNPASVGANAREWKELIAFCLEKKARLVNDAAYAGLASAEHSALAAVAKDVPELEWMELYSVSKSFSDPGARLGALIGSQEFVEDFILIKGNSESGPVPYVMAAYGEFFQDLSAARRALGGIRSMYRRRLDYVIPRLKVAGLRPVCSADDGFFTLWRTPSRALGVDVAEYARAKGWALHEAYNRLVIAETGLVGVHFMGAPGQGGGQPLIRYGVCEDVLAPAFQKRFEEQLARLKPAYE
ncbi:MAG: pyridoxal phosphate-dependent aminotransferase [Elusimicrobiota bacterium]|jgi:aspartate/methionine/tyrosine aminotransferase